MLEAVLQKRIEDAIEFRQPDRVPVCDFLSDPKVIEYFASPGHDGLAAAYHQLGIDVCWRFDRRTNLRRPSAKSSLKAFLFRQKKKEVLTRQALEEEFQEFEALQKRLEPLTYQAMSVPGCLSPACNYFGIRGFSEKMYTEPLEIERIIDIYAEILYQRAAEFARRKLGRLFFICDTIAYDKGLIFSPDFLNLQWIPRIKQAIEPLKRENIKVILHSLGDISSYLEPLIDSGIDGIHPVDREAGMNIGVLKKIYARSLILCGNISLRQKTPIEITAQVRETLRLAGFNGGLFLGSVQGIKEDLKLAASLSFFTAARDLNEEK